MPHTNLRPKYKKAHLSALIDNDCNKHLSAPEKALLLELLQEFEELFDGTLGDWDYDPVLLKLREGARPYHGCPFQIPKRHLEVTKKDTQRLCEFGGTEMAGRLQMGLANIYNTKKDITVQAMSDFCVVIYG